MNQPTTVLDAPARPLLTPTDDPRPVELAAIDSIGAAHPPETFLWIEFHRPDGGVRIRYAWTAGGTTLGDRTDHLALATGLDYGDWLEICERNCQQSSRGRIKVQAYPLRPVLADVTNGVRAPDDRRDGLLRFIRRAAEMTGQTPYPGVPRWNGVGPTLLNRPLR